MVNFTCQFEQQVARCLVKYYFWVCLWGFSWMRLMYITRNWHMGLWWWRLLFLLFFSCPVVSDSLQPNGLQHASLPVHHHLPVFAQVPVHCISDAIQPSHPLMPSSPSALNLSQHQGLFQRVTCSHQMTIILQLQHQSFQWIFRVDDLLAVQGTFRSLLQNHSLKVSILWRSASFMIQLLQPYMTTGKTTALTISKRWQT